MKKREHSGGTRLGPRTMVALVSLASFAAGCAAFAAAFFLLAPVLGMTGSAAGTALAAALSVAVCVAASFGLSASPGLFGSARPDSEADPVRASEAPLEAALPASADAASGATPDQRPVDTVDSASPIDRRGPEGEFLSPDEALLRETKIALKVQRRIVPRPDELPTRPELAFGVAYIPAENTGGDIYDAVRAGKNGYAFLVADVSGRGVSAALISAMIKNAFRSKASWHADAAEVMAAVNEELLPVLGDGDSYATAFYAVLDLENGNLSYCNAGHPPALLMRRRLSATENLDAEGGPLGLRADQVFKAGSRRLEEGDRIVFFTDGVTCARNFRGEEFSRERLSAAIAAGSRLPVAELVSSLAEELKSFTVGAPTGDDTVLMACEFRSFARPPAAEPPFAPRVEDDYPSLSRKGAYLASTGRIAEAARVYERLLSIEPEDPTALSNLGTLYWKMGRKAEAARRFREAARIDPQDPRIARNVALAERAVARAPGSSSDNEPAARDSGPEGVDEIPEAEPV